MGKQTLQVHSFQLTSSQGYAIHGEVKLLDFNNARPVIILSHGFRGHKDWAFWPQLSDWFAEQGFFTVSYNFSRIAAANDIDERQSALSGTITQELADLATVGSALLDRRLPLNELANLDAIGLLGHSRAGGSSLIFAFEHPELIKAVAVWNGGAPPQRKVETGERLSLRDQTISDDLSANAERFNLDHAFKSLRIPALIVQGGLDREQLLEQFRNFQVEAAQQHYAFIAGADHTFNTVHPYEGNTEQLKEAYEVTVSFFKKSLAH